MALGLASSYGVQPSASLCNWETLQVMSQGRGVLCPGLPHPPVCLVWATWAAWVFGRLLLALATSWLLLDPM